jgi:hypothetical protein
MQLKPQDLVVTLKLAVTPSQVSYAHLAHALGLNASEAHTSVQRSLASQLLVDTHDDELAKNSRLGNIKVHRNNLLEFVVYGAKYVFPATVSGTTVGLPTSHSAPVFSNRAAPGSDDFVWPYANGTHKGQGVVPLHPCVPSACLADGALYAALALLDALRLGRAHERDMAIKALGALIAPGSDTASMEAALHG